MDKTIFLASSSPRRMEILEGLGLPFVSTQPECDENIFSTETASERVLALAKLKAESVRNLPKGARWILGADTLIEKDGLILGKPADREDAGRMLRLLAGEMHLVYSGICLLDRKKSLVWASISETRVFFAAMSEADTDFLLSTGEWQGVAGSYRVQGKSHVFIERIDGSYSGVMGLPIREFYVTLCKSGYPLSSLIS